MSDNAFEDDEAWNEFTKSINKIKKVERVTYRPVKEIKINRDVTYLQIDSKGDLADLSYGSVDNIDGNVASKFLQNKMRVEGKLDLHGYTEDRAYDAVVSFIKRSYQSEKRCVIIVTGKGSKSSEDVIFGKGVLKNMLPKWLNNQDLRPFILSFNHPSENMGGEGALMILLRRKK